MRSPFRAGLLFLALALPLAGLPARAASLQIVYASEFSGGQAPGGAGPWITAVFDDAGGTGSVRLTMSTAGLVASENVKEWYFNLAPALSPVSLAFTYNAALSTAPAAVSITRGVDCCKADGDGKYDFMFAFTPATGLITGKTVVYDITGIASITAASFNFISTPAGGNGPFLSAAHVQNTIGAGSGGSGWVAGVPGIVTAPVPVPGAAWLLGSALAGLGLARRRAA